MVDLIKAIFACGLFFLCPIGFCFLLRRVIHFNLTVSTKRQSLAAVFEDGFVSWFVGCIALTLLFMLFEISGISLQQICKFQRVTGFSGMLFGLVSIVSCLKKVSRKVVWNSREVRNWSAAVTISGLVLTEREFVRQAFPVINVFQFTHLIEGAYQFGDYGVLNPHIANSYIPIFQVVYGLVRALIKIDLLRFWWISWPIVALTSGVWVFQICRRIYVGNKLKELFAISQVLFFPVLAPFSNSFFSYFLTLKSMEWICFYCETGDLFKSKLYRSKIVVFVVLAMGTVSIRFFMRGPFTWGSVLLSMSALLLLVFLLRDEGMFSGSFKKLVLALAAGNILGVCCHRSHLLVGFSCSLIPVLCVFNRWVKRKNLISVLIVGLVFSAVLGSLNFLSWKPAASLVGLLLAKTIDFGGASNGGQLFRNILIEWLRAWPVFATLLTLLAILSGYFRNSVGERKWDFLDAGLTFSILAIAVSLIGIPQAYRISFLTQLFFFNLIFREIERGLLDWSQLGRRKWLVFIWSLGALVFYWLVSREKMFSLVSQTSLYFRVFGPFLFLSCLGFLMVNILLGFERWGFNWKRFGLSAILVVIYFEHRLLVIRFYDYSFGPGPAVLQGRLISHYSSKEYLAIQRMQLEPGRWNVFLSDPVTLSNLKAIRGFSSAYQFENISDVNQDVKKVVLRTLAEVKANKLSIDTYKSIDTLYSFHENLALVYLIKRAENYNKTIKLHLLFNSRTLRWLECKGEVKCVGYFVDLSESMAADRGHNTQWTCLDNTCNQVFQTIDFPIHKLSLRGEFSM